MTDWGKRKLEIGSKKLQLFSNQGALNVEADLTLSGACPLASLGVSRACPLASLGVSPAIITYNQF